MAISTDGSIRLGITVDHVFLPVKLKDAALILSIVLLGHVVVCQRQVAVLHPVVVVDDVSSDPVDPRRQAVGLMELVHVAVNPQERLLKQIIGHMVIGDPTAENSPHRTARTASEGRLIVCNDAD